MKTRSKILLTMVLLAPTMAFSQSNSQGLIQLGLGFGTALGGATFSTDVANSTDETGLGAKVNFGIRGQYGLADNISAGIYIRTEAAAYAVDNTDINGNDNSFTATFSGASYGLEGKYYIVNKDRFNLYGAVGIGLTSGTISSDDGSGDDTPDQSVSGLNYLVNIGFNWYWADFIGMSLDLGYNGSSLSGTHAGETVVTGYDLNGNPVYATTPSFKEKLTSGGFDFGLGLITKFGGSGGGHSSGGHHHHH